MKDAGILLQKEDQMARARAKRLGLKVAIAPTGRVATGRNTLRPYELPWGRTLLMGDGVAVPWDLLPAGFHFLQRWDAAAPLWRYGVLAKDVGSSAERKRTEQVCKDLRLILFEPGLLFVRASEEGKALVAAWQEELKHGADAAHPADERLAFLRALHLVKPMFCALPRSWLAEARKQPARRGHTGKAVKLVRLEVEPGRFVKVKPGDEQRVLEQFKQMRRGRGRRTGTSGRSRR